VKKNVKTILSALSVYLPKSTIKRYGAVRALATFLSFVFNCTPIHDLVLARSFLA